MSRVIETKTHTAPQSDYKSASEMEEICCKATCALPCKERVQKSWEGYSVAEALDKLGIVLDENGRDAQGRVVQIQLKPRTKPCGEIKTNYDVSGENCCDGIEPLGFDADESVELLGDFSGGHVVITGGRPPFNVSVNGEGFYINTSRTKKKAVAYGRVFSVFTGDACGRCVVHASDGCSSASHGLKSENGDWYLVYSTNMGGAQGFEGGCPAFFSAVSPYDSETFKTFDDETAEWRIEQSFHRRLAAIVAARRPYSGAQVNNYPSAQPECTTYSLHHYPPGVYEYGLSGNCFEFGKVCMGCSNDCDSNDDIYRFSYDPGYHAAVTKECTPDDGWCWVYTGWSVVASTRIWQWRC